MGDMLNIEMQLTYLAQNSNLVPQLNYPIPMISINTPTKFNWSQVSTTINVPYVIPLDQYTTVVAVFVYNQDFQYPLKIGFTPVDNAATNALVAPGGVLMGTFELDRTSSIYVYPQNPNPADSLIMIAGT